jgi:hypothetical protein
MASCLQSTPYASASGACPTLPIVSVPPSPPRPGRASTNPGGPSQQSPAARAVAKGVRIGSGVPSPRA